MPCRTINNNRDIQLFQGVDSTQNLRDMRLYFFDGEDFQLMQAYSVVSRGVLARLLYTNDFFVAPISTVFVKVYDIPTR